MKFLIFCSLAFLHSSFVQGQCANGNISPGVAQPTEASLVSSTCSTLVVKWVGTTGQSYCVRATYFNEVTNKNDTVVGSNATCDADQNCTATIPVTTGTQITWSVQAISNGSASYPVINVLENPIPACSGNGVTICGKVLLQGAYDTATKEMRNTLNTLGILQDSASHQPYSISPFNYAGTEAVGDTFFTAHTDIVDWVLLELRDANAPSSIVAQKAAFVKQDGTLADTDGVTASITFSGVSLGKYHIAVRHRNHLGIRTREPVDFNCNSCYDFTTASFRSFKNQNYTSPAQMGTVWVMRAGNANVNENTRYAGLNNDENQILNIKLGGSLSKILGNVYAPEDVNMNGTIKWAGPRNDQNFLLNTALTGLLSTVFIEQF